ncbi:MAG TPA: hypothetical protein VFU97_24290 [Xanthobacteraceae bacterium]|nr:hypothetical protein [Xanthobacteraceae bacterium]
MSTRFGLYANSDSDYFGDQGMTGGLCCGADSKDECVCADGCGLEGCTCTNGAEPTAGEHIGLVLAARARNQVSAVDDDLEDIDF